MRRPVNKANVPSVSISMPTWRIAEAVGFGLEGGGGGN